MLVALCVSAALTIPTMTSATPQDDEPAHGVRAPLPPPEVIAALQHASPLKPSADGQAGLSSLQQALMPCLLPCLSARLRVSMLKGTD